MEYRKLGRTGLKVSPLCLGAMMFGKRGNTDHADCVRIIHRALDAGINFIDTANVYSNGESEEIVGKALRGRRDRVILATKVHGKMGKGPNDSGNSRGHILREVENCLRRLGTDYIDLYQCHRYDSETPLEETLVALDDLARQGKILYAGVSEWSAAQITHACDYVRGNGLHPLASNQPYYSLLGRSIEKEVIPVCEREGIGQVVFSPLAQGVLTGKYKPGQPLPEGSRAADPAQNAFLGKDRLDDATLQGVQKLQPIAESLNLSMAQLALAWCLRQKNVSSVIIGASRPAQVEDNAGASGVTLFPETLTAIDEALAGIPPAR